MSTEIQQSTEQSTASLVGGILADLQSLVEQQLRLTRLEIEGELRRRTTAAAVLVIGLALCLVGAIVMSFGLVYLLHTLTLKDAAEAAALPLWACYEIVGVGVLAVGGLLANGAIAKLRSPKSN